MKHAFFKGHSTDKRQINGTNRSSSTWDSLTFSIITFSLAPKAMDCNMTLLSWQMSFKVNTVCESMTSFCHQGYFSIIWSRILVTVSQLILLVKVLQCPFNITTITALLVLMKTHPTIKYMGHSHIICAGLWGLVPETLDMLSVSQHVTGNADLPCSGPSCLWTLGQSQSMRRKFRAHRTVNVGKWEWSENFFYSEFSESCIAVKISGLGQ